MARVKGGVHAHKRRTNILKRTKGYRHGRRTKIRQAHEGIMRAGRNAFAHRRAKKNDFRRLWIVRVNAAVRENGHKSYSSFMSALKKQGIELDRKVLAEFAAEHPEVFARLAKKVK
jgi:large subunit ribosomal protein L20